MLAPHLSPRFGRAFWALALAWLCAQCPQAALFVVGEWVHGAGHFSHQDRLVAEVARALSSSDVILDNATVAAGDTDESTGSGAALPMSGMFEKLLLALAEGERLAERADVERISGRAEDWVLFAKASAEPLHPPPRGV